MTRSRRAVTRFATFLAVDAKGQSQVGQPVIVPSDPPAFKGCIAKVRHAIPSVAKQPVKVVRAECAQLFKTMSSQVMDFLVKADWYEADAARLGIVPSRAEVDRAFNTQKAQAFPTASGFREFLAKSGETTADVRYRVLVSEILKRLVARENGSQTARQKALDGEVKKLYQPTTSCTAQVTMADCGSSRGDRDRGRPTPPYSSPSQ